MAIFHVPACAGNKVAHWCECPEAPGTAVLRLTTRVTGSNGAPWDAVFRLEPPRLHDQF